MTTPWREGNRLRLWENGEEFFPRVLELVRAARTSICIETFILADDEVGNALREALCAAARRGVRVRVLADGFGSDALSESFVAGCRDAGLELKYFQPRRRLLGWRTNLFRRMHRKTAVFDGRVAFQGGINFCKDHLRSSGPQSLQDYAVEVEGPVVADIQEYFDGQFGAGEQPRWRGWWPRWRPPPGAAPASGARVRFIWRDNQHHRRDIEREYRRAIRGARREIVLANAYFFPGYRLLRDLRDAARRGVAVHLIVQGKPDMKIVTVLARWLYDYLVPAGVRVHEFRERPLHAKVAVVDGKWSTVGSSNLDPLSLALNLESNLLIDDRAFAAELRRRLDGLMDASRCELVRRDALPARTPWQSLRLSVVLFLLRRFPAWAGWLPAHRPRLEPAVPTVTTTAAPETGGG